MSDDTAVDLQVAYDQAVAQHGAESPQALAAEQEARQYFTQQPVFDR